MPAKKSKAVRELEAMLGGPLTLGSALEAIRLGEGMSQQACATLLGISKSHLCDVEKGRKTASPERAARWANALGYPEASLVRLSLQGLVDAAGLPYRVDVTAA